MANTKRNFKESAKASGNTFNTVATGNTDNIQNTQPTTDTKAKKYRINLNFPEEYRDYLKRVSYEASSPEHIVSITEYLNELIRKDMEEYYRTHDREAK